MKRSLASAILFFALASPAIGAVDLPEVTIVGEAEEIEDFYVSPGTVTVVRPQEMSGEQKSLPELLKSVPGLHVIETRGRGAYTTASVRGSTASQVAVYVDGVLMNLGSEAAVDLSAIPVENVERIEVFRGYVPAKFGGASLGGVINIITISPDDEPRGTFSVGAGSFGTIRSSLSYSTPLGDGALFAGVNYDGTTGDFSYENDANTPNDPSDDYEAKRQNNGHKNTDLLVKWQNADWQIKGSWKRSDRDLPYYAPGADLPTSSPGATQLTDQWDLSAARRFRAGDLDLGVRLEYLSQTKEYDDPANVIGNFSEQHNRYKNTRASFAIDGSIPVGDRHLVEFLWNYYDEKLDSDGDVVATFGGISEHGRRSWNGQIQDTITLDELGNYWLTPILRWNSADGRTRFSGGAALTMKFSDAWSAKATWGTYNRAPNMYELYGDGAFVLANTSLEWEDGTQWDVGITHTGELFGSKSRVSLSYFSSSVNNLIEYMMTNIRYARYMNIGRANISGVELEANFAWDDWSVGLSTTWMDAISRAEDHRLDYRIPNRPEWEASLRVARSGLFDDRLSIFADLRYIGNNFYDDREEIKVDDLMTVGLGAKWSFSDGAKLVIGVDDIFDRGPETKLAATSFGPSRTMWYPIQGRTFYATFIWNF